MWAAIGTLRPSAKKNSTAASSRRTSWFPIRASNPASGSREGSSRPEISYASKQLDYFITAGDSYADIMANYADATGHAPPLPYWASGFWQCKLRYRTQEEFLNVAREYKRRGLPLSVLVTYPHIRAAMLLRERLRPYLMEQMKLPSERGLPPMRPLFFDFAEDPRAAAVEDQFLFGPDLLVAPVTRYGLRRRTVYLPSAAEWTDVRTGCVFQGGQTIEADAPMESIPVFTRGSKPALLSLFRDVEMLTFSFGALGAATTDGTNVTITLPPGTNVSSLAPTYTLPPGATGSPASGTALNFNTPQTYTVCAGDKATRQYRVLLRLDTTQTDMHRQASPTRRETIR